MKNKVIIFDMDGVLVDSIPFARSEFLKRHPGMTIDMYNEIHSGNFHVEVQKYSHFKKPETEEETNERKALYYQKKSQSLLFPGIYNLLTDLKNKGYLLIINTNAHTCLPLLENSNIKEFFDFIATAELTKDKVEKFKIIEKKYNITRDDVLFITDALGDIKDAETANIPTIAVTWGVHDRTFFERDHYPNLIKIVDTAEELSNFIKQYWEI